MEIFAARNVHSHSAGYSQGRRLARVVRRRAAMAVGTRWVWSKEALWLRDDFNTLGRDPSSVSAMRAEELLLVRLPRSKGFRAAPQLAARNLGPIAFIRIAPDGIVTIRRKIQRSARASRPCCPCLLPEELDVDWKDVAPNKPMSITRNTDCSSRPEARPRQNWEPMRAWRCGPTDVGHRGCRKLERPGLGMHYFLRSRCARIIKRSTVMVSWRKGCDVCRRPICNPFSESSQGLQIIGKSTPQWTTLQSSQASPLWN